MHIEQLIIVSALLSCYYWQEFNETLWEQSITIPRHVAPRQGAHIVALFRLNPSARSYGPWLVMLYAYRQWSFLCYFSATTCLNSMKLWVPSIPRWDAHILTLLRSDLSTQSKVPWLGKYYACNAIIVSVLFLCNYRQEFNETLWEPSIPRESAHIFAQH
jgi:hypothetical protein